MNRYRLFFAVLLVVVASQIFAKQTQSHPDPEKPPNELSKKMHAWRETVYRDVMLSGSLTACGHTKAGKDLLRKAGNLFSIVHISELDAAEAYAKGMKTPKVHCADLVKSAKRAGVEGLD